MWFPRFILISFLLSAIFLSVTGCNSNSGGNPVTPGSPNTSTGSGSGSTDPTVAYVYVSNQPSGSAGANQITAYGVAAGGQLTPVPGSPFSQNASDLLASGGYLVASSQTAPDINSYTIGSNGALTLAKQLNYSQDTGYSSNGGCGGAGGVTFDRTGKYMYAEVANIDCSSNEAIASFTFDSSNGSLSYLGNVNIGYESSAAISVIGTDAFAYSAFSGDCMYWNFASYAIGGTGSLSVVTDSPNRPAPPPGATEGSFAQGYVPNLTATDTTNHVAIAMVPCFTMAGATPPVQLATYTANADGALTTTDTYATMPSTTISPMVLRMSPSGSLLAVGGVGGLQVFHFNGTSPITSFSSVLTTDEISQVAWDNDNHLFAITGDTVASGSTTNPGLLYVFNVTSSTVSQAPGSPYTIAYPNSIAVQSENN